MPNLNNDKFIFTNPKLAFLNAPNFIYSKTDTVDRLNMSVFIIFIITLFLCCFPHTRKYALLFFSISIIIIFAIYYFDKKTNTFLVEE